MSDLISRKATINTTINMRNRCDNDINDFYDLLIESFRVLPSAEPEIIRCKDCKWCVEHFDTDGNDPYWICKNWDGGTDADGFCHEAERRTDE